MFSLENTYLALKLATKVAPMPGYDERILVCPSIVFRISDVCHVPLDRFAD